MRVVSSGKRSVCGALMFKSITNRKTCTMDSGAFSWAGVLGYSESDGHLEPADSVGLTSLVFASCQAQLSELDRRV